MVVKMRGAEAGRTINLRSIAKAQAKHWKTRTYGAELASTTAIKAALSSGVISRDRIILVSANDNFALVAANDNNVVAARLAA